MSVLIFSIATWLQKTAKNFFKILIENKIENFYCTVLNHIDTAYFLVEIFVLICCSNAIGAEYAVQILVPKAMQHASNYSQQISFGSQEIL